MITEIKDKFAQIFKKDFVVGLDIGAGSIKIAQFIKKEDGLHLIKANLKEIKRFEDSALREQEIVSALKDLSGEIDIKKSKVIAVINCSKTALKIATAPYMPKAELRDGINLEAKNYFPFPIDNSLLDYEILSNGWKSLIPEEYRAFVVQLTDDIELSMNKYFRGQALIAFTVGMLFATGFWIIDLPLGILLGLFIGVLNLVPYLQTIGFVPMVFLALLKSLDTGQSFGMVMFPVSGPL